MKATYLLIKSSVLSVTDHQKPSLDGVTSAAQFKRLNDFFNDSFIKVDNPEAFWNQADLPSALRVKMNMREREDGLYPAPDGIEFEVKPEDWKKLCGYGREYCMEDDMCQCPEVKSEKLAVVSLIDAKEKKKLPKLHEHNQKRYDYYDQPVNNNAGVGCEICGKEMQYVDQNLVTLSNPPSTKVICECGNSGYKVI